MSRIGQAVVILRPVLLVDATRSGTTVIADENGQIADVEVGTGVDTRRSRRCGAQAHHDRNGGCQGCFFDAHDRFSNVFRLHVLHFSVAAFALGLRSGCFLTPPDAIRGPTFFIFYNHILINPRPLPLSNTVKKTNSLSGHCAIARWRLRPNHLDGRFFFLNFRCIGENTGDTGSVKIGDSDRSGRKIRRLRPLAGTGPAPHPIPPRDRSWCPW